MPKYLVTNSSYFEPFTYEQLSAPVREMAQAHLASQDAYDTISTEAEALRRYIEQEPEDSNARAMYNSYMDKLTSLQNNLWNNGYNAQTRRDLSAARAGYASDISRLGNAIQTRQQRSAEYWKTKHDHPDMIMGDDPGLAGLDNYLADDRYGQNYYSYSGHDFMNQVGADAKARASEMLKMPEVYNDPRLVGYLERIEKDGFTSDEVARASAAVEAYLSGDAAALNGLDEPTSILAGVLNSNIESTGARGNVSNDEFRRLIRYGQAGLSQAIGKTSVDYMKDLQWERAQDIYKMRLSHELSRRDAAAAAAVAGQQTSGPLNDTFTEIVEGPDSQRTLKRTSRVLGLDEPYQMRIAKNGTEVRNSVDASQLVYSERLRMDAYDRLGFDIGRNPDTNGIMRNTDKTFLGGQAYGTDGKLYDVRYNTRTKNIERRPAGSVESWKKSEELTNYYNIQRGIYEQNLNRYKNEEPDIYKMAKVDPDKQAKLYKRDDIAGNTPLSSYQGELMKRPENYIGDRTQTWVVHGGLDSGYIDRVSGVLAGSLPYDNKGNLTSKNDWRSYDNTSSYIHKIEPNGQLARDAVKNPGDVFKLDKDGNISNIESLTVDPNAIRNGYIICYVKGSKTPYAIGLDMFRSDALTSAYVQMQNFLDRVDAAELDDADKTAYENQAMAIISSGFRSLFGYDLYPRIKGNTTDKDENWNR